MAGRYKYTVHGPRGGKYETTTVEEARKLVRNGGHFYTSLNVPKKKAKKRNPGPGPVAPSVEWTKTGQSSYAGRLPTDAHGSYGGVRAWVEIYKHINAWVLTVVNVRGADKQKTYRTLREAKYEGGRALDAKRRNPSYSGEEDGPVVIRVHDSASNTDAGLKVRIVEYAETPEYEGGTYTEVSGWDGSEVDSDFGNYTSAMTALRAAIAEYGDEW